MYEYGLSLTSQFLFCYYPLRLDTYDQCSFNCPFCFMTKRGGNFNTSRQVSSISVDTVRRRMEEAKKQESKSIVTEFIAQRIPIHFGGVSDPFSAFEIAERKSLKVLKILNDYNYPTIISTKSNLIVEQEYIEVIKDGVYILQISLSPELTHSFKENALKQLIKKISILASNNIEVCIRLQPILLGKVDNYQRIIHELINSGVKHYVVEHLKLHIDKKNSRSKLNDFYNNDVFEEYKKIGANRSGREWVLPGKVQYENIRSIFESKTNQKSISIGFADNNLLHFSKGNCCVGDRKDGDPFEKSYKYQISYALASSKNREVTIDSLDGIWFPQRSIGKMINSNSRIKGKGVTVKDYLLRHWNGKTSLSPDNYFGIRRTEKVDKNGNTIYFREFQKAANDFNLIT
jgi:DNA repair photolyase